MLPLSRERAGDYWRGVAESAGRGERVVLGALDAAGAIVGTVQLILNLPENQPHRGDLAKMLVHRRARRQGVGAALLAAFAVGCEAQLRIGNAISPAHYDHGWHITGTCGVFGAAVAASALLGLDAEAAGRALALAATMTAGHREAFGSMTKPLHAGKAAANGVLAARLAAPEGGPVLRRASPAEMRARLGGAPPEQGAGLDAVLGRVLADVQSGLTRHFPTWRTDRAEVWDIRKRFQWCMTPLGMNMLASDSIEYAELELYLTSFDNGKPLSVPGIRH